MMMMRMNSNSRRMDNPNEYAFGWMQQRKILKRANGEGDNENSVDDTNSLDNGAARRGAPDVGVEKNRNRN